MAKFCLECGAPVIEGASFCPECGASVLTAKPKNPAPNENRKVTSVPEGKKPSNYLWLSIVSLILSVRMSGSGVAFLACSIVSLVYSIKVNSAWAANNVAEALDASKKAKIWGLIGLIGSIVTIVLIWIFVILYFVLLFFICACLEGFS